MKKWKRCIAVIGILWCVGCTKEETQVSPPEETMTSYFELNQIFGTEDGCYYIDENSFLQYADFHKKKTALVCSRANCRHEKWTDDTPDEERCQAYIPGLNATGFVAQEKLYLFEPNMEEAFQSRLICSNLDRSNQKEVAVLELSLIHI